MHWLSVNGGLLGVALLGACTSAAPQAEPAAASAAPPKSAAVTGVNTASDSERGQAPGPAAPPLPTLAAGQQIQVPAGTLTLGSGPTTAHRDPAAEALLTPTEVAAFRIDRLPYPNDPARPAMFGVDRPTAAKQCAGAGKRLCSEAEWERACKGLDGSPYPTGTTLDPARCQSGASACSNALGLVSMGIHGREWTASDAPGGIGHPMRTAVLRGAPAGEPIHGHRCAARVGATADSAGEDIGFRCCSGPAPRFEYPRARKQPLVAPLDVPLEEMRTALAADARLAPMAEGFVPFTAADVSRALARGKRSRGSITAWHIASSTFIWTPRLGQRVWVMSGHSGKRSLVAAVYPMPDGSFVHAASTVIDEDDMSVALGYTEDKPLALLWTTCFGCAGEGGDLAVAEDGTIGFSFR